MQFLAKTYRADLISLAALGVIAFTATNARAQSVYSNSANFLAALQPDYYTETFNQATGSAASYPYASNGFGYTVTTGTGLVYQSGTFIGSNSPNTTVIFTFTTGNVNSVGGNFFNTNVNNAFVSSAVTLTVNFADGTDYTNTFTPASEAAFRGLSSSNPISSLVFSVPGANRYASIDNLTVGAAAPEPDVFVLLGVGALPLAAIAVRRRRTI